MNINSENLVTISILKNKLRKYKNIIFFIVIFFSFVVIQIFSDNQNIKSRNFPKNSIANIAIEGEIMLDEYRDEILSAIKDNDKIKAVLVNINSPGGGIVASEILFKQLKEISKVKPIVVLMKSVAASGGYMAALSSDYIIAHNGTITGSIGVIVKSFEVTELAKKFGIKFLNYKSSPLKASPSIFEVETEESKKVIKEVIDDSHQFFISIVKKSRGNKIKKKDFTHIFDGRIFNGRQALKLGLIDEIGDKNSAISYLKKRINFTKINLIDIELKKEKGFFDATDIISNFIRTSNILNF